MSQSSNSPRKVIICYDESEAGRQVLKWVNTHGVLLPTDILTVVTVVDEDLKETEDIKSWDTTGAGGAEDIQDYRNVVKHLEHKGRAYLAEVVEAIQTFGVASIYLSR
jgi:hypothetical protein